MFAINHAATALIFKRRFEDVPLVALLVSVQAMECAWVALNYPASSTRQPSLRAVRRRHPPRIYALLALGADGTRSGASRVVDRSARRSCATRSDPWLRDPLTSSPRSADAQWRHRAGTVYGAPRYGTFLYGQLAPLAFLVELAYGIVCWWIFRGSRTLLAVVVGFNLANISEFFRSIPGPEDALAGRPLTLVTVILLQIVVTMWAVWWSAGRAHPTWKPGGNRVDH